MEAIRFRYHRGPDPTPSQAGRNKSPHRQEERQRAIASGRGTNKTDEIQNEGSKHGKGKQRSGKASRGRKEKKERETNAGTREGQRREPSFEGQSKWSRSGRAQRQGRSRQAGRRRRAREAAAATEAKCVPQPATWWARRTRRPGGRFGSREAREAGPALSWVMYS